MRKFTSKSMTTILASSCIVANLLAADESATLDKSVISATGFIQEIKDAPATISVISSTEIMSKPIRDLGDIVQEIPGVSTSVEKTGATSILMRGMSSDYTLILVDGKRINQSKGFDGNGFDSTSGFIPPTSMIERVEVIRGPASLVYGSDAMGGVINIITKKNTKEAKASIGLETRLQEDHDTWGNTYGLGGNVFAPINDQLSINVRGKYVYGEKNEFLQKDIAGWTPSGTNPYTSHSPSAYRNYSLGGRLNWEVDPQNNIYADADYGFQRFGSLNTSSSQIQAKRNYYKYKGVLNHDGDYDWGKTNNYVQLMRTKILPYTKQVGRGLVVTDSENKDGLIQNDNITLGNSNAVNFDFKNYGSMIFTFGEYFQYEELYKRADDFKKDQYTLAGFAEAEYMFNEYFSTTTGARVNYIEKYGTFVNPRLYFNYYPTEDLTFKFGISTGLKAPQLGAQYDGYYDTDGTTDLYGNQNLDVEQTTSYEISSIWETYLADFTATAFYTEFKDAINTKTYDSGATLPGGYGTCGSQGGATCSIYENVDEATSKGFELAINSKPLFERVIPRGIYVDFSYGYTKTEQKSGDNKGKALNDVPKHNLTTKISYKAPSWNTYLRWVAKLDTPADNAHTANSGLDDKFKDMHVVDLGYNYKFKNGITVGAVINNLLDENFVDYQTYQGSRGLAYTNTYQRMIPRRNLWLTIRADF